MRSMLLVGIIIGLASSGVAQTKHVNAESADTKVIAVVLGENITVNEKDKLSGKIFNALLQQYAKENQIEPTDEELDAFVQRTEEMKKQQQAKSERDRERLKKELESASFSGRDRKAKQSQLAVIESNMNFNREMKKKTKGMEEKMHAMKRQMAQQFVRSWKINKALYEKYGGRLIFQQAGIEPLDAYRDFLKEQEKSGAFQIIDKQYEAGFWRYFTNDAMHRFYTKEDGAKIINTPWWMMDEPLE